MQIIIKQAQYANHNKTGTICKMHTMCTKENKQHEGHKEPHPTPTPKDTFIYAIMRHYLVTIKLSISSNNSATFVASPNDRIQK